MKNKISLRTVLNIFVDSYDKFINGYEKLSKLGNFNKLFCKGYFDEEYLLFSCYLGKDNYETDYGYVNLILSKENIGYKSIIYNNNDNLKKRFYIDAQINENIIKEYLDFFKEYKNLINAYNFFKKNDLKNTENVTLPIEIKGDFLMGLSYLTVEVPISYYEGDSFYIDIDFWNDYKMHQNYYVSRDSFNHFLDNTFFQKDKLPDLFKEELIIMKKLII